MSLYSDGGAMTVCLALQTRSWLDEREKESPEEAEYYRFETAEWPFEGSGEGVEFAGFHSICDLVREEVLAKEEDEDWFEWFAASLFEACVQVLERIRAGQVVEGLDLEKTALVFAISDDELEVEEMVAIMERINAPSMAARFKAWTDSWG